MPCLALGLLRVTTNSHLVVCGHSSWQPLLQLPYPPAKNAINVLKTELVETSSLRQVCCKNSACVAKTADRVTNAIMQMKKVDFAGLKKLPKESRLVEDENYERAATCDP